MNTIRIISDVHCEFGALDLPRMENESNQILVIAGDLGLASQDWTYMPFLSEWSDRFQDIIYIMGNHEYYNSSILRGLDKVKQNIKHESLPNIHAVNNEVVRIGNISFVCSTMWASYEKHNPTCMYDAELWMNDHKKIRTGPSIAAAYQRKFKAIDAYEEFINAINFIFPAIEDEKARGNIVIVVTHHAPSTLSISDEYKTGANARLNGAYASSLEEDIMDTKPNVWIHGHTHISFDYNILETRIICNPRGYDGYELNPNFNPALILNFSQ